MHGTTMMFLFAVPMMFEALSVYLVPLMVGTRNIAFPRLNAYSYYLYLFGGIMFYVAFLCNTGPDNGWFSYVPLGGPGLFSGQARRLLGAAHHVHRGLRACRGRRIIVTVFKLRAPGMSLNRIPLFVWGQTVVAFMVIFSLAGGHAFEHDAAARPYRRNAVLQSRRRRRRAALSASLLVVRPSRRSTSSSFRAQLSYRPSSRPSAAATSSAIWCLCFRW